MSELDDAVAHLAKCKKTLSEYQPLMDQLKSEMDAAKEIISEYFEETGAERIRKHGIVVLKSTTTTQEVTDMTALRTYLSDMGVLDRYTTIDTKRVVADYGHAAPGLRDVSRSHVSVRVDTKGEK